MRPRRNFEWISTGFNSQLNNKARQLYPPWEGDLSWYQRASICGSTRQDNCIHPKKKRIWVNIDGLRFIVEQQGKTTVSTWRRRSEWISTGFYSWFNKARQLYSPRETNNLIKRLLTIWTTETAEFIWAN